MQFLSVVERELRIAARKRGTFRVRMLTSAVALFISAFTLYIVTFFGSRPISGEALFSTLSGVAFIFACLAGPALTADCINEERNDGTLGLLFLTNLPGISIVLGKLFGHGLLALYSILSVVPVMALAALLGGLDGTSLAKTALVLVVTLILSLIVGMFSSTVCRKTPAAAALTLSILTIFSPGIPLAATLLRLDPRTAWIAQLEILSPQYALLMAGPAAAALSSNRLWLALGLQILIALLFFGLILALLPRAWKEGAASTAPRHFYSAWKALRYGTGEARRRIRFRLLAINPFLWLSCRERFGPAGPALLLVVLAWVISMIGRSINVGPAPNPFLSPLVAWIVGIPLLYLIFCFRLATAASERFATDRKAGALELILCTPIQSREIIRGHWLGLVRRFWGAAAVLFALHGFTLNYIIEAIRLEGPLQHFNWREAVVRPLRHLLGTTPIPGEVAPFYIACLAVLTAAVLIVVLWVALGWLGMALSLMLRREILASWVSLLLLAVPPLPVFAGVVQILARNKTLFATDLFLQMLKVGATGFSIVLANALLWLFLARRWTYEKLRANGDQ
jgi:ABC-type transport system involved in multi-copper enzyme maturation permease subunit